MTKRFPFVGFRVVDGAERRPVGNAKVVFPADDSQPPVRQYGRSVIERRISSGERGQLGPGSLLITSVSIRSQGPPILGAGVLHHHPAVGENKSCTCKKGWLIRQSGPLLGA